MFPLTPPSLLTATWKNNRRLRKDDTSFREFINTPVSSGYCLQSLNVLISATNVTLQKSVLRARGFTAPGGWQEQLYSQPSLPSRGASFLLSSQHKCFRSHTVQQPALEKKSNWKFSATLFGKLDQVHLTFHCCKKLFLEKVRQAGKYDLEQEFLKPALPLGRE